MMRSRLIARRDAMIGSSTRAQRGARSHEPELLEFLDTFDMSSFLHDPTYRRHLNMLLDTFTDEEFDRFEDRHARRFTLN
jgi:hypothetical protein